MTMQDGGRLLTIAEREAIHGEELPIIVLGQCAVCLMYMGNRQCAAYGPLAFIPPAIYRNEYDHRQPYPGDHGVRWTAAVFGNAHPMDD